MAGSNFPELLRARQFFHAATYGQTSIASGMVDQGMVPVDLTDDQGTDALMKAASMGHEATCRALLERGAQVTTTDHQGRSSLHYAANGGHPQVCQLLVERGADFEAQDHEGMTPLAWAHENSGGARDYLESLVQTRAFERQTAAVLADNFNPNAAPEANAVPSDEQPPARRQRMRL